MNVNGVSYAARILQFLYGWLTHQRRNFANIAIGGIQARIPVCYDATA